MATSAIFPSNGEPQFEQNPRLVVCPLSALTDWNLGSPYRSFSVWVGTTRNDVYALTLALHPAKFDLSGPVEGDRSDACGHGYVADCGPMLGVADQDPRGTPIATISNGLMSAPCGENRAVVSSS